MKLKTTTMALCLAVVSVTGQAMAQDGWYLRTNLGFAATPGLTFNARDNDWGTRCDKLSNPGLAETRPNECASAPPSAEWTHDVGRVNGVQSALALGYTWNGLRFEGEYLYRTTTYERGEGEDQILDAVTQEKQRQEIETLEGGLEDLLAHSVFANVYYESQNDTPYTPCFGVGVGLASTRLDYYGRFKRNDDPDAITTFEAPVRKARLAGTTTVGRHKMDDLLTAYQAVAGVDYALSGNLGVGARYAGRSSANSATRSRGRSSAVTSLRSDGVSTSCTVSRPTRSRCSGPV